MIDKLGKHIYLLTGYLAVALAVVGMFLPLMPTTCFLILAVWAFSRSAPDKARKILTHPRYGTVIRNWVQYRIISRKTKNIITMSIILMFSLSMYCYRESLMLIYLLLAIMTPLLLFINTRNEKIDSVPSKRTGLTI